VRGEGWATRGRGVGEGTGHVSSWQRGLDCVPSASAGPSPYHSLRMVYVFSPSPSNLRQASVLSPPKPHR
jgi:hypothetical protein